MPFAARAAALLVALALLPTPFAGATPRPSVGDEHPLQAVFEELIESGALVGGQFAVHGDDEQASGAFGVRAIGSRKKVKDSTLFLIASCSKPFASILVLGLAADPEIDLGLDDTIDRWLPAYAEAELAKGGRAERAPTVAELLCHRAGIYSQKVGITAEQSRLIYTFDEGLEERVAAIAEQPLLAAPGERYAYSGAGYCVLGRVAELAADESFEDLLQERLCRPLDLDHTTYFPAKRFKDIATGLDANKAPHALRGGHRFPLVGGSLYSNAADMVRFGRAVAGRELGKGDEPLVAPESWAALKEVHNPGKGYSLGWGTLRRGGEVVRLSHTGSLQGYRSYLVVDLGTGTCAAAVWTLADRERGKAAGAAIQDAVRAALDAE